MTRTRTGTTVRRINAITTINASNRTLLPYLGTSSGTASSGQWGYTGPQYREVASTIFDAMDDRLLLVEPENRARLSELLEKGDPVADHALLAYQAHQQWARQVHRDGSIPPDRIPTFTESEAGKQLTAQPSHRLIALAASLMADKVIRVRESERFAPMTDADHLTERLLDRLATRKLPYRPGDAAVLVDLASAYPWLEQLRLALNAARFVLDREEAPEVMAALRRLDALFLDTPKTLLMSKVMSYHPQVKALLANRSDAVPSIVFGADDAFGPAASRLIADRYPGQDVAEILGFLALPRGTRAPQSWWSEAKQRASSSEIFRRLVVDLLDLVSAIDLTGGSREEHGFYHPDVVLLGEVNNIVVRGAAWSARFVETPEIVDVLGRTVLRCSSLVQGLWGTEPLASKVAYAAVDSLVAFDDDVANSELRRLLNEVQATPVLRRIGQALGVPEPDIKSLIKDRSRHRLVHRRRSEN